MDKITIENSDTQYDTDATQICVAYLRELFDLDGMLIYLINVSDYPKFGIDIDASFYAENSFQIDQAIKGFFSGFRYAENRFNRPCQERHTIDEIW